MTEEKQLILNMLKDGKITVEEASDLLEAIGEKKSSKENDFASKISSTVDSIVKKATEAISSIDLDQAFDFTNYNIKGEKNSHKDIRIDDDIEYIDIDLVNADIIIERSSDSGIIISTEIYSKKEDLEDYLEVEIKDNKLNIRENENYKGIQANVNLKISVDKELYENLNIDSVNGKVELSDTDFKTIDVDTVNARIYLANLKANTDINNINGKVDLKNLTGNLSINNVNGPIYLTNLNSDVLEVDNVNGNIRIDGLKSKTLKASSTSGSIRIYNIKEVSEIDLDAGNGTIVVDTTDYRGNIRAFVESPSINATEKYINKIQTSEGYELSTNIDEADLEIRARADFGKVSLR